MEELRKAGRLLALMFKGQYRESFNRVSIFANGCEFQLRWTYYLDDPNPYQITIEIVRRILTFCENEPFRHIGKMLYPILVKRIDGHKVWIDHYYIMRVGNLGAKSSLMEVHTLVINEKLSVNEILQLIFRFL